MRRLTWRLSLLLLTFEIIGCSNEQVKQLTDQVSKQAEQVTKQANEAVQKIAPQVEDALSSGPTGEAAFQVDNSVKMQNAFGRLIILKPDRKNILQVRSYDDEADESFPSFLYQAQTDSENLQACIGQSFEGKLFIQVSANGPIWNTADTDQVTLKIAEQAEGVLVAEVVSGKLENDSGTSSAVKGTLRIAISQHSAEVLP